MRYILPLFFLLAPISNAQSQDTTRVLFLGNSYTFFNDAPVILTELAASMGHVVETAQNTPGGASLQGHVNNPTSQDLIEQGNWDYVVLQEQSQKPSLPYDQVTVDFFPAAASLVESIRLHNDCAIPLLYMTWGRQNGDASNCSWHPPVCTYEGMQELLTERYLEAADNTQSWCAPVGMVWEDLFNSTNINLYNADGSHPSPAGSYLAASTFFVALFGENPADSNYTGPIGPANSSTIDAAVWEVWQAQPNAWMQFDPVEVEFFTQSTPTGCNVQVSASPYVDSIAVSNDLFDFIWQDGDVVTLEFDGNATFDVVLYSGCDVSGTITETFYSTASAIEVLEERPVDIFPNPSSNLLFLDNPTNQTIEMRLRDHGGRIVQTWKASGSTSLEASQIHPGLYLLEIYMDGELHSIQKQIIRH